MAEEKTQGKAAAEKKPEPTHWLKLADGSTVDHYGAIPTHVATGDKVIPVVGAYER